MTSFLNIFIFSYKYVDFIGQEPCNARIRKRVPAKGIQYFHIAFIDLEVDHIVYSTNYYYEI